jgi:flagellar basal-body rod protein FlgF
MAHSLLFGDQIIEEGCPVGIYQNMAVVGLFRQEKRYDITANNLSNLQTAGYKKDVPVFEKVFSESLNSSLAEDPVSSATVFQQGDLQSTRNELDLAIEGEGFFKVKTPAGIRYTRNGSLRLNQDGVLVQSNGYPVLGRGSEISLRGSHIVIDKDGTIGSGGNSQAKIDLVSFPDLKGLKKEGNNLFRNEAEQEEIEPRKSQIHQGSLELSNVNTMEEMIRIIDAMRSFEACHKVVQVEDELNAKAVNELARV